MPRKLAQAALRTLAMKPASLKAGSTAPLAPLTKTAAKESARARRLAAEHDFLARQMGFGDDVMGAIALAEVAETAQGHVAAALAMDSSILGVANTAADSRSNLEFARFMRSAGVSAPEVADHLDGTGCDSSAVMQQLAKVEQVIGSVYPDEVPDDLVDELGELDDHSDDAHEEIDGLEEGHDLSHRELVDKASRDARGENSVSALGLLLKRIRGPRYDPLTLEAENALAARIKDGDQAACDELADHNLRFLVMMAKRFRYTGRPMDELVSAGTIGLVTAVKKFDPERGRFTTCAQQWIRQSIQRGILYDSMVKTPPYMQTLENKLRKDAATAQTTAERDALLVKADTLKREIAGRRAIHVSLDTSNDEDSDGGGLHNMFASSATGAEDGLATSRLLGWLVRAANVELKTYEGKPDLRARDVFLMRVGLHPDHYSEPLTLGEVGEVFRLSRERVRQIYNEAALDVANAVEHYALGPDNLPDGFRESLLSLGKRSGATAEDSGEANNAGDAAMAAIFSAEAAGPEETSNRSQLVAWLIQAANRELKTDDGKTDTLSRDVFLMRVGLHKECYGQPQSVGQVGRRFGVKQSEVRELYVAAAEEIAYAVEHYANGAQNLPAGFRKSLASPAR